MTDGSAAHEARKAIFKLGIRRGYVSLDEIDRALPAGSLTPTERRLLMYGLLAAGVAFRGGQGALEDLSASLQGPRAGR